MKWVEARIYPPAYCALGCGLERPQNGKTGWEKFGVWVDSELGRLEGPTGPVLKKTYGKWAF